ncbi:MAG TPA: RagB/SusD family nutrient uptake outer membrane protein [Gemmatimonadales bacterium]
MTTPETRETTTMWNTLLRAARVSTAAGFATLLLGGCSNLLEVDYPGLIPTEQLDDPSLAPVLVTSVIGDFECAYNNYTAGSSFHSDEFESANGNVTLSFWGERGMTAADAFYVNGACEQSMGIYRTLQTARFQSEDVFKRLQAWTDAQVDGRTAKMATVRAYGAYSYALMGETFCAVAFDGGPQQAPVEALKVAETQFGEAIALAQQAGNAQIVTMARAGLARVKMDLKKWNEAAQLAQQIPADFELLASRAANTDRLWNNHYFFGVSTAAYVVADAYRGMNDPRVLVLDTNSPAFTPSIELWITTKYATLGSPIRLASYREARLILAEALAQQGQVGPAMTILNARRAEVGLAPLAAATQAEAVAHVIQERRKELSFEGGHRLNDLLRYQIPWKVGANPYDGRPYGNTTCYPFPVQELQGS